MSHIRKILLLALTLSFSASLLAAAAADPLANPPTPAFAGQTNAPAPAQMSNIQIEVVASDLNGPRSLVALPSGELLVAEGSSVVRVINDNGALSEPISGMPANGNSLGDFIIDANFAQNRTVYFTYLVPSQGEVAESDQVIQVPQIAKGVLSADLTQINNVEVIAEIMGRRLVSSPDGALYITMQGYGDDRPEVQDLSTLTGKMLRINSDGSIPADNPYASSDTARKEIFEIGHRDPDGGFIHPQTGELWTIEHGPMGGDELNIIRKGENSGWPLATYGKNYDGTEIGPSTLSGTEQPLYYWFPSVATSGLKMYTGELFPQWQGNILLGTMSPTQGKFLVRLVMDGEKVVAEEHLLVNNDRRVRDVVQGRDGAVYVLTDSENNNQTDRHFVGQVLKLTPR